VILLVGAPEEGPMERVGAALAAVDAPFLMLDQSRAGVEITLEGARGRLSGRLVLPDGRGAALADIRAVYARLLDHTRFRAYQEADPTARAAADAVHAALAVFVELTDALVLNRTAAMGSNRSKPYQIGLIRRMGFAVPPTLVTNDPDLVRDFVARHGRVVFKSASSVRSIVTELDAAAMARLEAIRNCPVQFQALLEGLDVRVHVVGERVFATACESPVIDYRYAGRSGGTALLSPFDLPPEVAARCVTLAQALDLPLAGVDLKRLPSGEWACFEVNPSPGYSWFEQETGQPIAAAIAALLAGAR
jgi:glutathione synthase/RimK-type ligase-like ATP-grasp enzyme